MKENNDITAIRQLFLPFDNKVFPVRNRFVRSATWLGVCDEATGRITDLAVSRQAEAAAGGAGVVISEFAYVSREGRAAPRQWGLDSDEAVADVRLLAEAVHRAGSKLVVQICHAGAAKLAGNETDVLALSPSGEPYPGASCASAAMSEEEIKKVTEEFAKAAARVKEGGADGVEIHGAHGYLLTQFMSPLLNKRTDAYGGSDENRSRFMREVCLAVRRAVGPEFSVWLKISAEEGTPGGYGAREGVKAALSMIEAGVEVIEVSSGTSYSEAHRSPNMVGVSAGDSEAPFAEYAKAIREKAPKDSLVVLTGGLRSLPVIAALFTAGDADLFGLSRPFIAEPDLINRWAEEDSRPSACFSCNACSRTAATGAVTCPIMRDKHEGDWDPL